MKVNVIGMILNNAGRNSFEGTVLDDAGKPMSAANSLDALIMEYAKVRNGGESTLAVLSREVDRPIPQNGDERSASQKMRDAGFVPRPRTPTADWQDPDFDIGSGQNEGGRNE